MAKIRDEKRIVFSSFLKGAPFQEYFVAGDAWNERSF